MRNGLVADVVASGLLLHLSPSSCVPVPQAAAEFVVIWAAACTSVSKFDETTCASPAAETLFVVVFCSEKTDTSATAMAPATSGRIVITTSSSMSVKPALLRGRRTRSQERTVRPRAVKVLPLITSHASIPGTCSSREIVATSEAPNSNPHHLTYLKWSFPCAQRAVRSNAARILDETGVRLLEVARCVTQHFGGVLATRRSVRPWSVAATEVARWRDGPQPDPQLFHH